MKVLLLLAFSAAGWLVACSATVVEIPWDMGYNYKPYKIKCGDTLKFIWPNGVHGVRLMASGEFVLASSRTPPLGLHFWLTKKRVWNDILC